MTRQNPTYDEARDEGFEAAVNGAELQENPYSFKHHPDAWDGWRAGNTQHWLWRKGAA